MRRRINNIFFWAITGCMALVVAGLLWFAADVAAATSKRHTAAPLGVSTTTVATANVSVALPTARYEHSGDAVLPDAAFTPGLVRTKDAHDVCTTKTSEFRHTTPAMKRETYRKYGVIKKAGVCCEVDHLISLQLGGADDLPNLWPQPYKPSPGALEKDLVEGWLHRQVCSGKMSLDSAQRAIARDWYAEYQLMLQSEHK